MFELSSVETAVVGCKLRILGITSVIAPKELGLISLDFQVKLTFCVYVTDSSGTIPINRIEFF